MEPLVRAPIHKIVQTPTHGSVSVNPILVRHSRSRKLNAHKDTSHDIPETVHAFLLVHTWLGRFSECLAQLWSHFTIPLPINVKNETLHLIPYTCRPK